MAVVDSDLADRVRAWCAVDPDPVTRHELESLLAAGDDAGLRVRFDEQLRFGTAGLRGPLGGGPNRMNRVVVRQAARGLVRWLGTAPRVVIGWDARHNSDVFAVDTADVVAAAGGTALLLPGPVPTPVLAFAVRHLGADAGVMVTASHNPPRDNGYKVYLGDGAQLVAPVDREIEELIAAGGLPPLEPGPPAQGAAVVHLGDTVVQAYVDAVVAADPLGWPSPEPPVRVVHTALHGVGTAVLERVFAAAGLPQPFCVPSQAEPDGAFPTVAFPNPEEPGAMDAALALAVEVGADLVLANDPDADRLAVAVPRPGAGGGWAVLSGDEVGAVLGHTILEATAAEGERRVVASSLVSSQLLERVAAAAGVEHVSTLTGFKWIARVALERLHQRFVFGYEEALGYDVSDVVLDKDGISAALAVVGVAARARAEGRGILDVLDDLAVAHGLHATRAVTVRTDPDAGARGLAAVMARVRAHVPSEIAGVTVVDAADGLSWTEPAPTDLIRYRLADGSRVIIRPSGTEPKVKAYLEVVVPVESAAALEGARTAAQARLDSIAAAVALQLGSGAG